MGARTRTPEVDGEEPFAGRTQTGVQRAEKEVKTAATNQQQR